MTPDTTPAPTPFGQLLEAIDSLDDFARMEVGVDARGPRKAALAAAEALLVELETERTRAEALAAERDALAERLELARGARDFQQQRAIAAERCLDELEAKVQRCEALAEEWRTQNGDYPESKRDCADELAAVTASAKP